MSRATVLDVLQVFLAIVLLAIGVLCIGIQPLIDISQLPLWVTTGYAVVSLLNCVIILCRILMHQVRR